MLGACRVPFESHPQQQIVVHEHGMELPSEADHAMAAVASVCDQHLRQHLRQHDNAICCGVHWQLVERAGQGAGARTAGGGHGGQRVPGTGEAQPCSQYEQAR